MYINIIKTINDKHTVKNIQWWKFESFSSKMRNKTRVPTLSLLLNIILEVPATATGQEKELKDTHIRKKEVHFLCCGWYNLTYRKIPNSPPKTVRTDKQI